MATDKIKALKEIVTLRAALMWLLVGGIGFFLLNLSARGKGGEVGQTVMRDIGSLCLVTVTITFLWQVWMKRAFLAEILAKMQIGEDVKVARLVRVTNDFHRDIDWEKHFQVVNNLDIFFAYGRTWRSTHSEALKKLAAKKGARIRIVLPDPEDGQTVSELARRFNKVPEKVKDLIRETEKEFRKLRKASAGKGAKIDIWFLPAAPQFSFYLFDHIGIFALYSHLRDLTPVPIFVVEKGGWLYGYIRNEFDTMVRKGGLARLITDEKK